MNKTGWPVHLTKFGFTPPNLVCPVYTSKQRSPCVNLPHHMWQSMQNYVCRREKNKSLHHVHFDVPFSMSLLSLICEILVGVELYLLRFNLLEAFPFTCVRCASSMPMGPLALVEGWWVPSLNNPQCWPQKRHHGPKKKEWKGYSAAHTVQEKALAAVQSHSEWVFQFNSKLKAASVV